MISFLIAVMGSTYSEVKDLGNFKFRIN